MTTSPTSLLEIARSVALEAGALAKKRRSEGVEVAASKSSREDIVTFADRETESLIRSRLAELRPGDGFFGEESTAEAGTTGLTWVVDPIDGTVNFLYGIPHYVTNPATGETFTAARGGGAFLDGRAIAVAPEVDLSQALVGTGFAYLAERRSEQAAVLGGLLHRVRDIRRMGVASLDLCAVACGRLNAYFERGLSPWDFAAGALIAQEAGARVGGMDGDAASRDLVLAAEPRLAARLEELLRELGA
jgi:myo-inositol-1(or 4)-monophosphatase